MEDEFGNRRSPFNSFRVEEEFTNRQVYRVVCAASVYVVFITFLLCVFYVYVLHPTQIGRPSLLSFPSDFRNQWLASSELRGALQVWLTGMVGMTATFAVATGLVLSRKLAGPIHRLKTDLRRMKDGAPVFEIILRDNDELMDLTALLNETLVLIENRHVEHCRGGSNSLSDEVRSAGLAEMRTHLESLTEGNSSADEINAWTMRMRDLIDKAEAASTS